MLGSPACALLIAVVAVTRAQPILLMDGLIFINETQPSKIADAMQSRFTSQISEQKTVPPPSHAAAKIVSDILQDSSNGETTL